VSHENLDLLKGTFGLLLLKAVSADARHGHDIMKWLRSVTDGTFLVEEGALYPALHRLEKRQLLQAEWRTTENNRRAKYYRLTGRGLEELQAEEERWNRYVTTVGKVLEAGSA
jgi:transcriptional regulator